MAEVIGPITDSPAVLVPTRTASAASSPYAAEAKRVQSRGRNARQDTDFHFCCFPIGDSARNQKPYEGVCHRGRFQADARLIAASAAAARASHG